MEYIRGSVNGTGVAVNTEEIVTPVSKTEKLAMLIHEINMELNMVEFLAGVQTYNALVVSRRSHEGDANIPEWNDQDVLHYARSQAVEGIIVGSFSREQHGTLNKKFDPPLLYTKSLIYIEAGQGQAGQTSQAMTCAIGYTLEEVSREAFIDALVG